MQAKTDWQSMKRMDRIAALLEEKKDGLRWFLCRFTNESGESLGVAFIRAYGPVSCSIAAHCQGIRPGGQMHVEPVTEAQLPVEGLRHRLLNEMAAAIRVAQTFLQ